MSSLGGLELLSSLKAVHGWYAKLDFVFLTKALKGNANEGRDRSLIWGALEGLLGAHSQCDKISLAFNRESVELVAEDGRNLQTQKQRTGWEVL